MLSCNTKNFYFATLLLPDKLIIHVRTSQIAHNVSGVKMHGACPSQAGTNTPHYGHKPVFLNEIIDQNDM